MSSEPGEQDGLLETGLELQEQAAFPLTTHSWEVALQSAGSLGSAHCSETGDTRVLRTPRRLRCCRPAPRHKDP